MQSYETLCFKPNEEGYYGASALLMVCDNGENKQQRKQSRIVWEKLGQLIVIRK